MASLLFFTGPQLHNAPQADWSREFEGLKTILENQSCIELEPPTFSGKRSDFVRLLSGKKAPDLLHFSGHGQNKSLLLLNEFNQQSVLQEDEAGSLFAKCPQMGVVLNACSSARVAESISERVLFAIGYQGKLQDEVAIAFTKSFYRCLCDGEMLADAFKIAVLEAGGNGLHVDTKPLLFCNSKLDPRSYRVGPGSKKHSTTGQIPDQGAHMASQSSSMSSGSGKQQDPGLDREKIVESNEATTGKNNGVNVAKVVNNGSVTINIYNDSHPKYIPRNTETGIPNANTGDPQQFESVHRSIYYRDREMIAREVNQEFNLCLALADSFDSNATQNDVKDQVIDQFVNGEKPADWLSWEIIKKYNRGYIATEDIYRGLKSLLFISLIVQMPPDIHELLSMEVLRVTSDDTETLSRRKENERDVGTSDKEFITLSLAMAISITNRDLSSNNEFLTDIIRELRDDDWGLKFNERVANSRIKPYDFAIKEKEFNYDMPAIQGRSTDQNLKVLCKDLLDMFGQTCYPNQSEIDVLNHFLDKVSQIDFSNLNLFALILPSAYCRNLIDLTRKMVPKLLVIPVSSQREKEFQHLRTLFDSTMQILDLARRRGRNTHGNQF